MKYLTTILLLMGCTLTALGQPAPTEQRTALTDSTEAEPTPQSVILQRTSENFTTQARLGDPPRLGVTPYLRGLVAPSARDEFPARVPTVYGSTPVDYVRIRPSSVGGWAVQIMAEIVCTGATDDTALRTTPCDAIGTQAYGYPRFRPAAYP